MFLSMPGSVLLTQTIIYGYSVICFFTGAVDKMDEAGNIVLNPSALRAPPLEKLPCTHILLTAHAIAFFKTHRDIG